uniref:Uncharacterized protein n=1 Tax=Picea glauca TaxID=3330 RepID=A0A101M484_PICGL|nr:hypothetical protein ABT39_MTgene421 [Picea glauca]
MGWDTRIIRCSTLLRWAGDRARLLTLLLYFDTPLGFRAT